MRAVIFDLWDTLVDYPVERSREYQASLALRLGAEPERFDRLWLAGRHAREVGPLHEGFLALGFAPEDLEELVAERREFAREALQPRPGVLETLRELRRRGYALGMISVCSEDVALVWDETPLGGRFDVEVFSATCGLRKPDAAAYRLALDELGVEPGKAIFVGDGANDELAGAERVGMRAVLIHRPGEEPIWPEARGWRGPRITSIPEVLDVLDTVLAA